MSEEEFIIAAYAIIDTFYKNLTKGREIRKSGPKPMLFDQEVITMQIVGEFLGIDGDKNIWEHFKLNWSHYFPRISDRTTFVKQIGNLGHIIAVLQKAMASELNAITDQIHITDGFPVPICNFRRAKGSKIFKVKRHLATVLQNL